MSKKKIKNHYKHWLPPLLGAIAVTIGRNIYYVDKNPPDYLRRHEEKHVEQYAEYGLMGFLFIYLYHYLMGRVRGLGHWEAYAEIPFEVEARRAER